MRIAMVSMHTSPLEQPGIGDAGGMNVYVLALAKQLAEQGVVVDIFTRATRPSQGEIVEVAENLRVINVVAGPYEGLPKEELPTQLAAFTGGVVRYARHYRAEYDLIHSHYWLSGQVGWLLRDLWRVPLVHTAHTLAAVKNAYLAMGDSPESEARRICEQQLVDNADLLVVNTEAEVSDLVEHYDADETHIVVVSPGADVCLYQPGSNRNTERSRRNLGIPLYARVVLFVGRLQELKGPQVLIRATAEMVKRDPSRNLRVIICGGASGSSATVDRYRSLAEELGVAGRIRFIDPRPPEELVSVYQAADVVALPSFNESFGLVAIEAQATGTPVVASNVGGLPIAVDDGKTGILVRSHDPQDWADALSELLDDDKKRITMGKAAIEHGKRFSWANSAQTLLEVYDRARRIEVTDCDEREASGS